MVVDTFGLAIRGRPRRTAAFSIFSGQSSPERSGASSQSKPLPPTRVPLAALTRPWAVRHGWTVLAGSLSWLRRVPARRSVPASPAAPAATPGHRPSGYPSVEPFSVGPPRESGAGERVGVRTCRSAIPDAVDQNSHPKTPPTLPGPLHVNRNTTALSEHMPGYAFDSQHGSWRSATSLAKGSSDTELRAPRAPLQGCLRYAGCSCRWSSRTTVPGGGTLLVGRGLSRCRS